MAIILNIHEFSIFFVVKEISHHDELQGPRITMQRTDRIAFEVERDDDGNGAFIYGKTNNIICGIPE